MSCAGFLRMTYYSAMNKAPWGKGGLFAKRKFQVGAYSDLGAFSKIYGIYDRMLFVCNTPYYEYCMSCSLDNHEYVIYDYV